MPNYKEGLNSNQQLLFPPSLDEYVDENNPVRAMDSYVILPQSVKKTISKILFLLTPVTLPYISF